MKYFVILIISLTSIYGSQTSRDCLSYPEKICLNQNYMELEALDSLPKYEFKKQNYKDKKRSICSRKQKGELVYITRASHGYKELYVLKYREISGSIYELEYGGLTDDSVKDTLERLLEEYGGKDGYVSSFIASEVQYVYNGRQFTNIISVSRDKKLNKTRYSVYLEVPHTKSLVYDDVEECMKY